MSTEHHSADSPHPLAPAELSGQTVHFVGIGGCGMSGLARVVQAAGARCTGSDRTPSPFTDALVETGFDITFDQGPDALPDDCDLVVISAALTRDHPEVAEADRRGIPVLKYAQMLGQVMMGRDGVAIAGTHGKSTTTAMLAHALLEAGLDPGFIIGANCEQIGGNARAGGSRILLGEACEFDRSFHNLHPRHGVILNIEEDHLDIYGSLDAIVEAFAVFAQRIHPDGSLLIGHEGAQRTVVAAGLPCAVDTIGFAPQADWQVTAVASTRQSATEASHAQLITIHRDSQPVCQFTLALPGDHMAYNAAVAAVTAHRLGAEWSAIGTAL
ncbi:MAG: Mur ligase domain-containing protein, partial [Phycisphaerae bacterium]|nr:Mur ligase domain-containing protein [Phycisphaerae bacterium]